MTTIMIVERHDLTRYMLHSSVECADYSFSSMSVATSETAVSLLERGVEVDFVVTGDDRQDMPPLTFLRRVRSLRPTVPIVVLTTSLLLEVELLNGGAAAVLQRSMGVDALLASLSRALFSLRR